MSTDAWVPLSNPQNYSWEFRIVETFCGQVLQRKKKTHHVSPIACVSRKYLEDMAVSISQETATLTSCFFSQNKHCSFLAKSALMLTFNSLVSLHATGTCHSHKEPQAHGCWPGSYSGYFGQRHGINVHYTQNHAMFFICYSFFFLTL